MAFVGETETFHLKECEREFIKIPFHIFLFLSKTIKKFYGNKNKYIFFIF